MYQLNETAIALGHYFFLLLLYTKDATGHDIIVLRGFSPREGFQRFLMTHCPPLHERYI